MSWWRQPSVAARVLEGALVTRRGLLKGALVLAAGLALPRARVLVQVPDDLCCSADDVHAHLMTHVSELSRLLKRVYGPPLEQQQNLTAALYRRFESSRVRGIVG